MKRYFSIFLMLGCVACLAGCSSKSDEPNNGPGNENPVENPVYPSLSDEEIGVKANEFSFGLIQSVQNETPDKNIVISPYSMYTAASLLANGAAGETRAQIIKVLGFDGANVEDFNRYNKNVISAMKAEKNVDICLANSVWHSAALKLVDDFSEALAATYDAKTFKITRETLKQDLNDWCNENTKGQIPYITLPDYSVDLIVANALYFKGPWEEAYDPAKTENAAFNNLDGTKPNVPFMNDRKEYADYFETGYSKVAYFSLKSRFNFAVVLPDEGVSLSDCLARIKGGDWAEFFKTHDECFLNIKLPKFKVEKEMNLMNAMNDLGMAGSLSNGDFRNLVDKAGLSFGMVNQKATLQIDEKGVVGAAVTTVSGVTALPEQKPEIYLTVDRPFLFFVFHRTTGAILFSGQVTTL